MTSSLVGSEMCIRDSPWTFLRVLGPRFWGHTSTFLDVSRPSLDAPRPVSYTHLTLPTICSV
eukprot:3731376-Prorocentrum_lima.AAC.1